MSPDCRITRNAAEALRVLFADVPGSLKNKELLFTGRCKDVISMLYRALSILSDSHNIIDCAEALNEIIRLTPGRTLLEIMEDEFFEMLISRKLDIADYLKKNTVGYEQIEFFRKQFLAAVMGVEELRKLCGNLQINPACSSCLSGRSILDESPEKVVEIALMRDPFTNCRTFRYLPGRDDKLQPCDIKGIPTDKFCGFYGVRSRFDEHLSEFATGKTNVPLLISSLPGLGKTQFTIAYTLANKDLTLIFAEPETLSENLEELIAMLALRKRRKFVVFFDDIEPDKVNWYSFRTNVGGSASLPANITFVLASNYQFPINILSRGREITFPVFDEVRCMEMVEDFLADFGLKNANENLAAVIAAGYIEDFGQKKFTELSPRTLMRYLEQFQNNAPLRRKMLEQSRQEMIVKPDAQLFYEFNIKLLRQLYGASYIDELREEKLRNL